MALTTSIENFLRTAQVAINNTLSTPEILAIVSEFGYTEAELTKGQKLYDAALAAQQAQQKERKVILIFLKIEFYVLNLIANKT